MRNRSPLRASILLVLAMSALGGRAEEKTDAPDMAALNHVAIHVKDLSISTAFYKDIFGLSEVPAPFPIARWLKTSNGLMLHIVSGRNRPLESTRWDHFALACNSIDAFIARLEMKGIPWGDINGKPEVQVRPDGVKQIFVRDPDGYWIEVNDELKR